MQCLREVGRRIELGRAFAWPFFLPQSQVILTEIDIQSLDYYGIIRLPLHAPETSMIAIILSLVAIYAAYLLIGGIGYAFYLIRSGNKARQETRKIQ